MGCRGIKVFGLSWEAGILTFAVWLHCIVYRCTMDIIHQAESCDFVCFRLMDWAFYSTVKEIGAR